MRISDWSSDVCSSDLARQSAQDFTGSVFIIVCNDDAIPFQRHAPAYVTADPAGGAHNNGSAPFHRHGFGNIHHRLLDFIHCGERVQRGERRLRGWLSVRTRTRWSQSLTWTAAVVSVRRRSEEHTSELPSLLRITYAVFCLKKKNR